MYQVLFSTQMSLPGFGEVFAVVECGVTQVTSYLFTILGTLAFVMSVISAATHSSTVNLLELAVSLVCFPALGTAWLIAKKCCCMLRWVGS